MLIKRILKHWRIFIRFLELFVLFMACILFFAPSPPVRENYLGILAFAPAFVAVHAVDGSRSKQITLQIVFITRQEQPFLIEHKINYERFLHSLLWVTFVCNIFLMIANFNHAPYARSDFWVVASRPLLGWWLVYAFFYNVELLNKPNRLLKPFVLVGVLVGAFALTSSQWGSKNAIFVTITQALPVFPRRDVLPEFGLSFNVNEIGGAMAFLFPIALAGVWQLRRGWRSLAGISASMMGLALVLGQSRFALFGVGVAVALWAVVSLRGRWRWGALVCVLAFALLQVSLTLGVAVPADDGLPSAPELSARDQSTLSTRFQLWERALAMTRDHPLTGVGMMGFRRAIRTPDYAIPYFEQINFTAPHAHNNFLQWGTDFGVFGWALWGWMHALALWALWQAWRAGKPNVRAVAVALAAGLLAHGLYGLGDAITLFDRFAFLWWLVLGACFALYRLREA